MAYNSLPGTITALQLHKLLASHEPFIVLDVREHNELEICTLPTFVHIPLGTLLGGSFSHKEGQISKDSLIVTLCHHGYRSLQAALFLKSHGFDKVMNLTGGIQSWAEQVDRTMPKY